MLTSERPKLLYYITCAPVPHARPDPHSVCSHTVQQQSPEAQYQQDPEAYWTTTSADDLNKRRIPGGVAEGNRTRVWSSKTVPTTSAAASRGTRVSANVNIWTGADKNAENCSEKEAAKGPETRQNF